LHQFVKGLLTPHRNAPPAVNTEPWSRPEARIVAAYFILASAWIVGSDLLLTSSAFDNEEIAVIQSLKGLNFVITTALLLFFVLRRAYDGWRIAEERRGMVVEHARERFRTLCSHVQELREMDRIRIAREIHDELGQLLTGIKMEVRLLENQLADHDDRSLNPAIDKLVEISELVDDTIASVQNIAAGLRPSALDNQGLGTALIDEAGQFSQRSGIPCSIVVEDSPDPLPPEVSTAVFRIFQESLTNVARHANARRIDSKLSVEGNVLKLEIHDDGKGIDPSILDNPKSLGLIGMVERAESVGGLVTFKPHPQQGTDVVLTVPL
jgi:signal transduction histidine kinase